MSQRRSCRRRGQTEDDSVNRRAACRLLKPRSKSVSTIERTPTMGGWNESYEQLCELDKISPLEPAKLIELATSAYLIGKDSEGVAALMRAHQAYVRQREFRQAA